MQLYPGNDKKGTSIGREGMQHLLQWRNNECYSNFKLREIFENLCILPYSWLFSRAIYFMNLLSLATSIGSNFREFLLWTVCVQYFQSISWFIFHEFGCTTKLNPLKISSYTVV